MTNLWCHPGLLSSSRRRGSIHFAFALFLAFFFVACSDDGSDFATKPSGDSSSSVKEVTPKSSDSETSESSSSIESSSSLKYGLEPCDVETEENCIKDDRDGQTYRIVKIGEQVWMAQNLNYEVDSSFCYRDSAKYCEKYGRLYMWAAAVGKSESECGYGQTCSLPSGNIQGACPRGWHLPSKTEWETLCNLADYFAGRVLKAETEGGSDNYGFSAFLVGYRTSTGGGYGNLGSSTYFWYSTEYNDDYAYYITMRSGDNQAWEGYDKKSYGHSVRCVQD